MKLPELHIGDLVAKLPIVQGGMGVGISLSGLASAVANEGGIGVIATAVIGMKQPDLAKNYAEANIRALREEIRAAREKSKGVLGVNIMCALSNFADMVKTAVDEKIDVIFSGAGLPLDLPKYVKDGAQTKLVPIISSGRAASILCKKWLAKYDYLPDAFVVEGPKAGGHLGFKPDQIEKAEFQLENIVPDVVEAVKPFEEMHDKRIPVIAAGGVYSGEDIAEFIRLGASGVQMGTRFVATEECDADDAFKQTYVDAKPEDIGIIQSPVGLPGRAIINGFLDQVKSGLRSPVKCIYHCISSCPQEESPYCIGMALTNAQKGKMKHGFAFAGSNAHRVDRILTVRELMASLKREYEASTAAS